MKVARHNDRLLLLCCLCWGGLFLGCAGRHKVPPPEEALKQYVKALDERDSAALKGMLKKSARDEYTEKEILDLLDRDAREFKEWASELLNAERTASGKATVYLRDGRRAELSLEDGVFKVHSAGVLPARPASPETAVLNLRDAVLARNYHLIEQTLSKEAREEFAGAFERLGESLKSLDTATINVRQDSATVEFIDGRMMTLRREGTVWKIEAFE